MAPKQHHITIDKQGGFKLSVNVLDSAGAVRVLTGFNAKMSIKGDDGDALAVLTLTSNPANGITVTPLTGNILVIIPRATTAALAIETGEYDLLIDDGTNPAEYLLQGGVTVVNRITTP